MWILNPVLVQNCKNSQFKVSVVSFCFFLSLIMTLHLIQYVLQERITITLTWISLVLLVVLQVIGQLQLHILILTIHSQKCLENLMDMMSQFVYPAAKKPTALCIIVILALISSCPAYTECPCNYQGVERTRVLVLQSTWMLPIVPVLCLICHISLRVPG